MKYFICGYKKLEQLPDCAKNLLCELSDRGHEFLIRKLDRSDESFFQSYDTARIRGRFY